MKSSVGNKMRVIHRYLGFFLAGIMAMYAVSGILMIYRNTDFLKSEVVIEKQLDPGLAHNEIGPKLKSKVRVQRTEGDIVYLNNGTYNSKTGFASITKKELPYVLGKMEKLHKATTNSPLYFLNIFFGVALLFFVISAFWMFMPKSPIFKKGLYYSLAGIILTLILVFI